MSIGLAAFEPAELLGDHYHPIGGTYGSLDLAVEAVRAHCRNKHGGSGTFRVYESRGDGRGSTIVEVVPDGGNPLSVRALYRVVVDEQVREGMSRILLTC